MGDVTDVSKIEEWTLGLKVGDEVAVRGVGLNSSVQVAQVTERARNSRTRKLVMVGRHGWFNKRGCREPYVTWGSSISPVTDAVREEVRRRDLLSRLSRVKWEEMPTSAIEAALLVAGEACGGDSPAQEVDRDA